MKLSLMNDYGFLILLYFPTENEVKCVAGDGERGW